jgi:hypothetical protein
VDGSGNVVITGASYNFGTYLDYYTAKYAAEDGALIWEQRYNSPTNRDDSSVALAIDGSGNIVVTGYSVNRFNGDYQTLKYAALDGSLLWERRYNGPANGDDIARAVAVDADGNVVVTGISRNSSGNDDCYTAKYAAADGAILWEKRFNGPANGNDIAQAVAVDALGNAVITGHSWNGTNYDYYTASYAASDGALLWEKRYNSPLGGDDLTETSRCLALGPGGAVIVAGSSNGDAGPGGVTSDFATVKYVESPTIQPSPGGDRALRFPAVPGQSYSVQRSASILGPWVTLATMSAPATGFIAHTDKNPPPGSGFYRLLSP